MTKLTRRLLILSLASVPAIGIFALREQPLAWIKGCLQDAFGKNIAQSEETTLFVTDYLVQLKSELPIDFARVIGYPRWFAPKDPKEPADREKVINAFILSTNIILSKQTNAELEYLGLFDPYANACSNPLSAHAL
ncbi:MAG: hypothetical protein ACSHXD_00430 [Marinosulfonomonas sp.]